VAGEFIPTVAEVAKTFGCPPKLLANSATGKFSFAARPGAACRHHSDLTYTSERDGHPPLTAIAHPHKAKSIIVNVLETDIQVVYHLFQIS
jgi:hypothetical protein